MKRSMWGITLMAAAAGLWSCNGDPTGDLRAGERIQADPASVFVQEGATKFVTVELVDGQGNQLATDFAAQDIGGGITVVKDPTFLHTTINTNLPTQARFVVTGVSPVVSSFVVTAGDTSLTVPVRVLPGSVAATFSNAAPAQNEVVTITAPAGFSFANVSGVVVGADTGIVVAHAADGTTVSFVPRPGLDTVAVTRPPTIIDARSALYPTVPLTLPSLDALTVAPVVSLAGTSAPGSAPAFTAPLVGFVTAFFDKGTFTGTDITPDAAFGSAGAQYYQIIIPEAGDYSISLNWDGPTDVDGFLCRDTACSVATISGIGPGTAQPETSIFTLAPGTYYLAAVSFHSTPAEIPPRVTVTITRP
jgi:hypothetical protein